MYLFKFMSCIFVNLSLYIIHSFNYTFLSLKYIKNGFLFAN